MDDEDKVRKLVVSFWKNLIVNNMGMYLFIDGLFSILVFIFFNTDPALLFVLWLSGIPRYIAGAMAGAKSLSQAVGEVSKE